MTSPYPPPSNQPGGDGWGGDLNSPFGPSTPGDQASPYGAPPPQQSSESQEPSPYEGVQYELDSQTPPPPAYPPMSGPPNSGPPGGQPHSGPPGYGPPPPGYGPPPPGGAYPPPPPPQKSGSNTGLIVGGVIGGVVLLMVLAVAAVFIIVDDSGSDRTEGNSGSGEESSEEDPLAYRMNSDPCGSIKSDVEALGELEGGFDSTSDGSEFGGGDCGADIYKSADDFENMAFFHAYPNVVESEDLSATNYESSVEIYMADCQTTELSGAWEQGTIGTCDNSTSQKTVISVQDANLEATLSIDIYGDLGVDDPEGTLQSMTEKILDDLKA